MSRWWRAYDEALNDPKLQGLPPPLFKFWFNMMCVASQHGGVIPPLDVLKTALKARLDHVKTHVKTLLDCGLIDEIDGNLEPHNWRKRQYKSDSSTERVQAHRVAKCNVSETPPETETEYRKKDDDGERGRLLSDDALSIASELGTICGFRDAIDWPLGWSGAHLRIQTWLNAGWPRESILAAARDAMARKRDGPPNSINYFEKPIVAFMAKQSAPLPEAKIIERETVNVIRPSGKDSRKNDFAAALDQMRTFGQSRNSEAGGGDVRMLPAPGRGGPDDDAVRGTGDLSKLSD